MVTLYADYDVAFGIVEALRGLGHIVATTRDIGQEDARDDEQLMTASVNGWVLVSHNRQDFIDLHFAWLHWSRVWSVPAVHAGIVIIPQQVWTLRRAAEVVDRFLARHHDLRNTLHICDREGHWQPVSL